MALMAHPEQRAIPEILAHREIPVLILPYQVRKANRVFRVYRATLG
jgi:hypothetical protein